MSENQNKDSHTFQVIVIILLAVIICLQAIHCIKLYEISYNSQLTNMVMFGGNVNMALKQEANWLKTKAKKLEQDVKMEGKNFEKDVVKKHPPLKKQPPENPPMLLDKETVDESNNLYTIEMQVPKNLKKDDLYVELQDGMLGVSFGGSVEMETDNSKSSDVFSVYKFFSVPETKATNEDVTYDVKDGLLKITVPLIK